MLKEIFWEMSYGDEIMCSQARRQELTLDTEVEFLLDAVVWIDISDLLCIIGLYIACPN